MTRKEAQIIIGNIPIKPEVLDDCYTIADYQEAKTMAIKALGQGDVLDKIRGIVDEWKADSWTDNLSYECMVKIADAVAESEDEE